MFTSKFFSRGMRHIFPSALPQPQKLPYLLPAELWLVIFGCILQLPAPLSEALSNNEADNSPSALYVPFSNRRDHEWASYGRQRYHLLLTCKWWFTLVTAEFNLPFIIVDRDGGEGLLGSLRNAPEKSALVFQARLCSENQEPDPHTLRLILELCPSIRRLARISSSNYNSVKKGKNRKESSWTLTRDAFPQFTLETLQRLDWDIDEETDHALFSTLLRETKNLQTLTLGSHNDDIIDNALLPPFISHTNIRVLRIEFRVDWNRTINGFFPRLQVLIITIQSLSSLFHIVSDPDSGIGMQLHVLEFVNESPEARKSWNPQPPDPSMLNFVLSRLTNLEEFNFCLDDLVYYYQYRPLAVSNDSVRCMRVHVGVKDGLAYMGSQACQDLFCKLTTPALEQVVVYGVVDKASPVFSRWKERCKNHAITVSFAT